jgi:hypothetical protein
MLMVGIPKSGFIITLVLVVNIYQSGKLKKPVANLKQKEQTALSSNPTLTAASLGQR